MKKLEDDFVNSPLSTIEQRDKLLRKPIHSTPSTTSTENDDDDDELEFMSPPNSVFKQSSPAIERKLTSSSTKRKRISLRRNQIISGLEPPQNLSSIKRRSSSNRSNNSGSIDESYVVGERKLNRRQMSTKVKESRGVLEDEEEHSQPSQSSTDEDDDEQPALQQRKIPNNMLDISFQPSMITKEERRKFLPPPPTDSGDLQIKMIILIILVGAVTFWLYRDSLLVLWGSRHNLLFSHNNLSSSSSSSSRRNLREFEDEFKLIRRDFSNVNDKYWPVISSGIKRAMRPESSQPGIILLIGRDRKVTNCLAKRLLDSVSEASKSEIFDSGSLSDLNPEQAKETLFESMSSKLGTAGAYGLTNIEKLHGKAAMTLHAFCDNLNAPFKSSVIILTLIREDLSEDSFKKKPEILAENILIKAWKDHLGLDKFSALISRVVVSVALVSLPPQNLIC